MDYRSFEWRIIVSLILLLMLIQVGGYFVVLQFNRTIAAATLVDELGTGSQVVNRLLAMRHERLQQAVQVLAGDFGLRETLASGDLPTIRSMLDNHGKRIDASLVILSDTSHQPITLLMPEGGAPPVGVDPHVLKLASTGAHIAALGRDSGQIYQLISTPVMSPKLTSWLTMGFAMDTVLLSDLGDLNDIEISLLARSETGVWEGRASTLPESVTEQIAINLMRHTEPAWQLSATGERYQMLSVPLHAEGEAELVMVLGLSLERALAPYQKMERVILMMLVMGLLLSAVAVYFITRNMIAPLNRMAHLDSLTGLANRRLLGIAMRRAEAERARVGTSYTLFMLDLDKFKALNDTYGHAAGDQILKTVADRLRRSLRGTDIVARQGGDEFVALLPDASKDIVERLAEKVVSALTQPMEIAGNSFTIGVSLGIAVADATNTLAPDQLLHLADRALYQAKSREVSYVLASTLEVDFVELKSAR